MNLWSWGVDFTNCVSLFFKAWFLRVVETVFSPGGLSIKVGEKGKPINNHSTPRLRHVNNKWALTYRWCLQTEIFNMKDTKKLILQWVTAMTHFSMEAQNIQQSAFIKLLLLALWTLFSLLRVEKCQLKVCLSRLKEPSSSPRWLTELWRAGKVKIQLH